MDTNPPLPTSGTPPYPSSMEARVAVLEQIAISTRDMLVEIRQDLRGLRSDVREEFHGVRSDTKQEFKGIREELREIRAEQKSDFRFLFGALITTAIGLATFIAHGFKWL